MMASWTLKSVTEIELPINRRWDFYSSRGSGNFARSMRGSKDLDMAR